MSPIALPSTPRARSLTLKASAASASALRSVVRTNVEEYCISGRLVRVQAGKSFDRKGQPLTIKLNRSVEAWYEDLSENAPTVSA
jgi:hypothetical protein